ncbi:Metallo-dependent phosphatase-like protein [Paraphoma chrysanthemicola]|nr:Metallo-dependent phosphatase-like protein [Paraphoma chrysanthemicola]
MTSATPSIKTRFLIISDTHSASPEENVANNDVAFRPPLPKADVLLHCGDLTMAGLLNEYERTLDMLESIDAGLKLVIAGNHDISLDEVYYTRRGKYMHRYQGYDEHMPSKAKELWKGERARRAGVTYLEEGTHTFTLANGAKLRVYASPYQPEFCDWAFPYFRDEDRYNPAHRCAPDAVSIAENPIPDFGLVDVMMTHGPPMGILDAVRTGDNVGCQHLLRAAQRCRPRLHCFGHIHEGWGAQKVRWQDSEASGDDVSSYVEKIEDVQTDHGVMTENRAATVDATQSGATSIEFGKETLMVNASIMTLAYKPWNAPWLVDVDLEKA